MLQCVVNVILTPYWSRCHCEMQGNTIKTVCTRVCFPSILIFTGIFSPVIVYSGVSVWMWGVSKPPRLLRAVTISYTTYSRPQFETLYSESSLPTSVWQADCHNSFKITDWFSLWTNVQRKNVKSGYGLFVTCLCANCLTLVWSENKINQSM